MPLAFQNTAVVAALRRIEPLSAALCTSLVAVCRVRRLPVLGGRAL